VITAFARVLLCVGAACALEVSPPGDERRVRDVPEDTRPLSADKTKPGTTDAHVAIHDERARLALARGIDWLAKAQDKDGAWPATGLKSRAVGTGASGDGSGTFAPVAVTALATLALLAAGNEPDRGPHGRETARAVDWLVARTDLDARSERAGYIAADGDALSRMHGHGYATQALAQAFAMSPKTERGARIESALQAAVTCIQKSQGIDGGWWYEPKSGSSHENSITICAVQALRAAHNAGAKVDAATIQRAVDYVSRTQKSDGSFRYALGDPKSSVALTSAAIATLNATGKYDGKAIAEAYDWIFRRLAVRDGREPDNTDDEDFVICPHYERLCLAQALWQHADARVFDDWWSTETPRVLTRQKADGSWEDPRYGDAYATAMNCLLLALPEGLLPIFQR
jgi:hypothetical protein